MCSRCTEGALSSAIKSQIANFSQRVRTDESQINDDRDDQR